jgi:hypothetical protein
LPPIPKQKWMFIAILRDGRRFDIIYNNYDFSIKRYKIYIPMPAKLAKYI